MVLEDFLSGFLFLGAKNRLVIHPSAGGFPEAAAGAKDVPLVASRLSLGSGETKLSSSSPSIGDDETTWGNERYMKYLEIFGDRFFLLFFFGGGMLDVVYDFWLLFFSV